MDQSAKRFAILQLLLILIQQIFAVITSLYIWQYASLRDLLLFLGIQSLISIFTYLFAGWGCDRLGYLTVLRFGLCTACTQMILLLVVPKAVLAALPWYAALCALTAALLQLPLTPLNRYFSAQGGTGAYYGVISALSQIVSLVFPLVSGIIISIGGYIPLFFIALGCVLVSLGVSLMVIISEEPNQFSLVAIIAPFTVEKRVNITVDFFWGLENAILGPFLPILTITLLGSVAYWGIFTSFLGVLALGFSYLFIKRNSEHLSVGLISIFAFLLSAMALTFSVSTSLFTFVVYMIVLRIWQTIQSTSINYILDTALFRWRTYSHEKTELALLSWIPFLLGKGILSLALVPFAPVLQTAPTIGILFAFAGFFVLQQQVAATLSHKFVTSTVE